jgi:hypothetical protein
MGGWAVWLGPPVNFHAFGFFTGVENSRLLKNAGGNRVLPFR